MSLLQEFQGAMCQHRTCFMDTDHFFVECDQVVIFLAPRIGPAVVRIGKSTDSGLIAVIDRRYSRPGHLHHNGLTHDRHVDILGGCLISQVRHTPYFVVRSGQETRMVMVGKLVHRHLKRWCQKACHMMTHCSGKCCFIAEQVAAELIAVLFHSGKEPGQWLHKGIIIHNGIPFITAKPGLGIAVMFCQNDRIRIGLFYDFAEFFPELMVIFIGKSKVSSHIQSPAIDIERRGNPFLSDLQNIIVQLR